MFERIRTCARLAGLMDYSRVPDGEEAAKKASLENHYMLQNYRVLKERRYILRHMMCALGYASLVSEEEYQKYLAHFQLMAVTNSDLELMAVHHFEAVVERGGEDMEAELEFLRTWK